ncbi:MAG TPA: CoA-binding protein [Symbiobacteriaceae bacterium]|nr:CoA-binding protein [Symbiobacteriaceae bacterium]
MINEEKAIVDLLQSAEGPKVIAVVGLSDKPDRPSYRVAAFMQKMGYRIVPVTPKGETILGEPVFRSLAEIPFPVDVVDVFRAPEHVPAVLADVKQMQHRPTYLWLQEGVVHDEAAAEAEAYGLKVVMDRCLWKEHDRVHGRAHH